MTLYIFMGQTGAGQLVTDYNVEKNAVDLSAEPWIKNADPLSVNETTVNGKVYGQTIVDNSGGWVIVYNKNIFKKLALNVPKTFAEFKDICQKLLAAKITPIYEPSADGWHHVLWFPEEGPRWEELTPGLKDMLNKNKTTFAATAPALTTLQQMEEMYNAGFFGPNTLSDTNDQATAKLADGTFAMYVGNMSTPKTVEKAFPNVKADTFGFFPNPLLDNQMIVAGFFVIRLMTRKEPAA